MSICFIYSLLWAQKLTQFSLDLPVNFSGFPGVFSIKSDWKILKKIKPRICLPLLLILDRGSHMTNCNAGVMSLKQVVQMLNFWTNCALQLCLVWEPIEPQNALLKYYCTTWPCLMLALPIFLWISILLKEID